MVGPPTDQSVAFREGTCSFLNQSFGPCLSPKCAIRILCIECIDSCIEFFMPFLKVYTPLLLTYSKIFLSMYRMYRLFLTYTHT